MIRFMLSIIMVIMPFLAEANSWCQFHGDATHIGYANIGPGSSYFNSPGFVVGSELFNCSSPCVCNNKVFTYGQFINMSNDTLAKIVAFNKTTGDSLWTALIAKAIWDSWSSPAADLISNSVYIASSDTIYRIDASSGAILWRSKTKDIVINASPTINIEDSLVYIHTYAGFGTITFLQAFRISDGTLLWSDSLLGRGQTSVAHDDQTGRVYTALDTDDGSGCGKIGAFDAVTGNTIWLSDSTYAHGCYGSVSFDAANGFVMAGGYNWSSTSSMLIVNASDGSYVREIDSIPSGDYTPTVGDSFIYAIGNEGTSALNPNTGAVEWTFPKAACWRGAVSYAADDGTGQAVVYAGGDTYYTIDGRDTLYMLDAINGTVLAVYGTAGGGTPAIEQGNIYFISEGSLVALGPSVYVEELADNSHGRRISKNYPNPFRDKTVIAFSIGYGANSVSATQYGGLKIYDVSGRIVKVFNLASGILPLASSVCWDGKDDNGKRLSNGIYMYVLKIDDITETGKMLMLK